MIQLSEQQYEALQSWGRVGAEESGEEDTFLAMRKKIDLANGLQRYTLVIRYDTLPQKPAVFGQNPTGDTRVLELTRKPTREDVLAVLAGEKYDEPLVYVTADPSARVGWYELASYPWD